MPKTRYRSIFISDTHLCSRDAQAEVLLHFLRHTKSENLYLVGDFLDVWQLRRRWHWPQVYSNVIHRILSRVKKGAKVVYIPGNHDEFFRDFLGTQFGGVQIVPRTVHRTADGRRMLVMHGDEFDAVVQCNKWLALLGSAAYEYLVAANRILNVVRRRTRLPYWSLAAYCKRRVKNAAKYISRFETALAHEGKTMGVDGVICGHIHTPVIKNVQGLLYCNTGDWVENCTALVEHEDGRLEIVHWLPRYLDALSRAHGLEVDPEDEEPQVAEYAPFATRIARGLVAAE
ncbi:MAG: UDP-2,3-diacylglucosamine diphosphatase [Planctomycetota bacterium]|nr:UDP-2,3-diacylglucosamine diphosphatase [Planctomycetota bacterium]